MVEAGCFVTASFFSVFHYEELGENPLSVQLSLCFLGEGEDKCIH